MNWKTMTERLFDPILPCPPSPPQKNYVKMVQIWTQEQFIIHGHIRVELSSNQNWVLTFGSMYWATKLDHLVFEKSKKQICKSALLLVNFLANFWSYQKWKRACGFRVVQKMTNSFWLTTCKKKYSMYCRESIINLSCLLDLQNN